MLLDLSSIPFNGCVLSVPLRNAEMTEAVSVDRVLKQTDHTMRP